MLHPILDFYLSPDFSTITLQTAVLDFGTAPESSASVLISGVSNLVTGTHIEAFIQCSDTTSTNSATDHRFLSFASELSCEIVSSTSFNINCDLVLGLATGTFIVHWVIGY